MSVFAVGSSPGWNEADVLCFKRMGLSAAQEYQLIALFSKGNFHPVYVLRHEEVRAEESSTGSN